LDDLKKKKTKKQKKITCASICDVHVSRNRYWL